MTGVNYETPFSSFSSRIKCRFLMKALVGRHVHGLPRMHRDNNFLRPRTNVFRAAEAAAKCAAPDESVTGASGAAATGHDLMLPSAAYILGPSAPDFKY